jgi:glycosyltransferase involved in cell wall biosynthesis
MKVTVIIYAKNEIDGMKSVVPKIRKEWYDELIVIDGHSTDGTYEYCRDNGYTVYQQEETFWAGAYKEGHKRATGDIIVDFSPDGNSVPELIPQLTAKIKEGYDMVIASRYTGGAKSEDDTLLTRLGNAFFTGLVNLLFRAKYTDVLVIYRAYRKGLLAECGLDKDLDHAFTTQVAIRAAKIRARTMDIPGDEPKRVGGVPKMNVIRDGLLDLILVMREFFFWKIPGRKSGAPADAGLHTNRPGA